MRSGFPPEKKPVLELVGPHVMLFSGLVPNLERLKAKFTRWQGFSKLDDWKPQKSFADGQKWVGKNHQVQKMVGFGVPGSNIFIFFWGVLLAVRFRFVFLARAIS